MESGIMEVFQYIVERISERYMPVSVCEKACFTTSSGVLFMIEKFPGRDALVVCYADDLQAAEKNRFEDGDLFYLDDTNKEEMLTAILREIEECSCQ